MTKRPLSNTLIKTLALRGVDMSKHELRRTERFLEVESHWDNIISSSQVPVRTSTQNLAYGRS